MFDPVSQIFDRYLDQPPTLPVQVRRRVEQACQGEIIQLYALADLDASLRLCQIWVALTANHLAVIRVADRHLDEHIRVISRKRLEKIIEQPGLSCTVVHLLERDEEHPFVTIRYTHRQRGGIGHLLTFWTNNSTVEHSSSLRATSVTEKLLFDRSERHRPQLVVIGSPSFGVCSVTCGRTESKSRLACPAPPS